MAMNSLINPRETSSLTNPAVAKIRWSGKAESVKDSSTGQISKEGGTIYTINKIGEGEYERVDLGIPFVIYPLGETMSVGGGTYQQNRVTSSEFCDWDEPIKVYNQIEGEDKGNTVATGLYTNIKEDIKQKYNAKLLHSLYGIAKMPDHDEPVLIRFEYGTSVAMALDTLKKSVGSANFFEKPLLITAVEYKKQGSVDYAVPVFKQGDPYDDESRKKLEEFAKIVVEYGQKLRDRNMGNSTNDTQDYSQERPEGVDDNDDKIDLADLPF